MLRVDGLQHWEHFWKGLNETCNDDDKVHGNEIANCIYTFITYLLNLFFNL